VNPAFPKKQLVGVFSLDLARLYGYLHQNIDKHFAIIHSLDGYDEVSLTSGFKVVDNSGERIMQPEDLGLDTFAQEDLFGGNSVDDAARIFMNILKGEGTKAQNQAVVANAALALK